MPLELSQLMQLGLGLLKSVPVGDLPRVVAVHLGCHPAVVYLGYKELYKIAGKHTDVAYREFQFLPYMISDGRYVSDPKRASAVTVFYRNPENGLLYTAGLKSAERGGEVWISTLHRTTDAKVDNRTERATIIRDYRKR